MKFLKKFNKKDEKIMANNNSKEAAKERLHLVLMQDRANVSSDFLEIMKQEIIDVIKKYIDIDESAIDVRLTNKENEDGTNGAPALYANIPIVNIKNDIRNTTKEIKRENSEDTDNIEEEKIVEKEEKDQEDCKDEKIDKENDNKEIKNKEENKEEKVKSTEKKKTTKKTTTKKSTTEKTKEKVVKSNKK